MGSGCSSLAFETTRARIEAELQLLPPGLETLALRRALDRSLPPELARLAAELHELRRSAARRLDGAASLWLTRKGLEQATRSSVARVRAERIAAVFPGGTVLDATAGIGSDALALSEAGLRVVAADLDPELAAIAAANLCRRGQRAWAVVARAEAPACRADAVLIDPDRRPRGRRTLDPAAWSPSLAQALAGAARFRGACLKLAPSYKPPAPLPRPHAWEWVSVSGELLELSLWLGELAPGRSGLRSAVRIGTSGREAQFSAEPVEVEPLTAPAAAAIEWLAEPDPALIGAGLLGALARELGMAPLGPSLGFLGGPQRPSSPFLRSWRVLDAAPADPRRVRAMLARHGIGPCEVMKRGHPATADELAHLYHGKGDSRGLLAVARLAEGHRAYLLEHETSA